MKQNIKNNKRMIVVAKKSIIIERIDEKDMTKKEKRLMKEALRNFKAGRRDKFVSLEELKKRL